MADISYTVSQDLPENINGFEQYSQEDRNLISSFQVSSVFDPEKNYSELHILSLSDELLESDYLYNRHKQLANAQSAGQGGASVLTIDPIADSLYYGYDGGGVKLLYHFLDDLYTNDKTTKEFYIQDISPDRTEILVNGLDIAQEDLIGYTTNVKNKLDNEPYFAGFRLNFKNNDLIIATNLDTIDSEGVRSLTIKLYEPLPDTYDIKSTLNIVEIISDSIAYEVDSEYIIQPQKAPTLRSANFNIDIADQAVVPTEYLNYDELFSYPINNTNSEIFSAINEKGISLSVNYTDFSNFIHFSSAEERLMNFKYKVDLIDNYSASLATYASATTGLQGISGSRDYYQSLLTGVVNNFDHYERFLYYESGSSSWPKDNTTKPYINLKSTDNEAVTWYSAQIQAAAYYDQTNYDSLVNTIPAYLRDDANNSAYLTFIHMVGQHFDDLWLYSKAVTDKYDGDNRGDRGISKDLVGEALRNFGVKLYTSNKSTQDLFSTFTGQTYQSGSEKINNYVAASTPNPTATALPNVVIGDQTWTLTNLDVTTYSDGTIIPQHTGTGAQWITITTGSWCYYENRADSGSVYGKLYNWYAVQGIYNAASLADPELRKQIAPTGWHVSSDAEWETLDNYVGTLAGVKLKSTDLWTFNAGTTGTNSSGFTGLPGGYRQTNFAGDNDNARFWTSTQDTLGHYRSLNYNQSDINITTDAPYYYGNSVRLVLDPTTTPIQPTSLDDYQKEVQKRLYHNLPLLLKTKGTQRGIKALLNCFGIPREQLDVKLYGGRNIDEASFFGDYTPYSSSIDKIRIDNTGSISQGSTLSSLTSIVQRDNKYTDDLHTIEIGFSPTTNIDNYIISQSQGSFNIDDYLGDPRNNSLDNYSGLLAKGEELTSGSVGNSVTGSYDLQDYIRLIKFYDNTVFKMIKDFTPARSTIDTGIIIKPTLLNRSKNRAVAVSAEDVSLTGSIDTAFIQGADGGTFNTTTTSTGYHDTSWVEVVQTPRGLGNKFTNSGSNQPLYTGELSGSRLIVSDQDLNAKNPYKLEAQYSFQDKSTLLVTDFPEHICAIDPTYDTVYVSTPSNVDIRSAFNIPGDKYVKYFSASIDRTSVASAFPILENYTIHNIIASKSASGSGCQGTKTYIANFCIIEEDDKQFSNPILQADSASNIESWFSSTYNTAANRQYTASWYSPQGLFLGSVNVPTVDKQSFIFSSNTIPINSTVYITAVDPKIVGGCSVTTSAKTLIESSSILLNTSTYTYISSSQGPNTSILAGRTYPLDQLVYNYWGTAYGNGINGLLLNKTWYSQSTPSLTPPTASGGYTASVYVPADTYFPPITSPTASFSVQKAVITVTPDERNLQAGLPGKHLTASISNSFTMTGFMGNDTSESVVYQTGTTFRYFSNFVEGTPASSSGIFLSMSVNNFTSSNYTFVSGIAAVAIGASFYAIPNYSPTDYQTSSISI